MSKRLTMFGFGMALLLSGVAISSAHAEQRIALVIGNGAYPEASLDNPVRDAIDVSARLRSLGFEVVQATDADLATMQDRLLEFIERIELGATAMVYYAGHGIQADGRNYLLPVDASFRSEQSLRFEALEVADILEELERSGSGINLVVLDACRNNPFARSYRGGSRGLAVMDAAAGTLIAYATAPGAVASDGSGANGLYTQEFLNALSMPGLKVEEVFKQVRIQVARASNGEQIPWESSSLTGDFVFNPSESQTTPQLVARAPGETPPDTEALYWASIVDSADPILFEDYLNQFPDGTFASIATRRIDALTFLEGNICGDLSGHWTVRNESVSCESEFWLTQTGPTSYDMEGNICNLPMLRKFTGTTELEGSRLTTQWTKSPCTGVTQIELADDCRSGVGEVRMNTSLLCRGTSVEEIEFLGRDDSASSGR